MRFAGVNETGFVWEGDRLDAVEEPDLAEDAVRPVGRPVGERVTSRSLATVGDPHSASKDHAYKSV